jgi:NAD(P)-dependent dehydrogenase (short-subunit alcohol dehydrogenase family)
MNFVLTTGTSRGIGYGVVRSLANEHPPQVSYYDRQSRRKAKSTLNAEGPLSVTTVEIDATSDALVTAATTDFEEGYPRCAR